METRHEDDVAAQLEKLRADIASLSQTIARLASDRVEGVRSQVHDAAQRAADAGREALDGAQAAANVKFEQLETRVREKPLESVLMALGIGFLLGLITRR